MQRENYSSINKFLVKKRYINIYTNDVLLMEVTQNSMRIIECRQHISKINSWQKRFMRGSCSTAQEMDFIHAFLQIPFDISSFPEFKRDVIERFIKYIFFIKHFNFPSRLQYHCRKMSIPISNIL